MGNNEAWSKAWWAEKLIIPILVGLSVFVVQFIVPKLIVKDKELSIQLINARKDTLSSNTNRTNPNSGIKNESSQNSIKYSVKISNSGALPLKNIPVRLIFKDIDSGFKIIRTTHKTIPEYEFGSIKDEKPDSNQLRFVYSLLNPDDEDLISIWANREIQIKPYAKAEGMELKIISSSKAIKLKPKNDLLPPIIIRKISSRIAFFFGVLGALLSELTIVFNFLINRKKSSELPRWLISPFYWMITCMMSLFGGLLVFVYDMSGIFITSPLLAVNIGASAPLIIQHMMSRLPEIELGKSD